MTGDIIGAWFAAFFTLAIFSFLYRDNPVYKLAEHVFVGVATGYALVMAVAQTIKPNFWDEVLIGFSTGDPWKIARIGAGVFGILFLLRLYQKSAWLSTWPLALMVGTFAILRMTGRAQSDLIGQLHGTFVLPLYPGGIPFFTWEGASFVNNLLIVGGVISVLIYFFFSLEHRGALGVTSKIGIYFLMVTFGSSYGYTVMARVSLLIGRVDDLYTFATPKYYYATPFCFLLIAFLILLDAWRRTTLKKE